MKSAARVTCEIVLGIATAVRYNSAAHRTVCPRAARSRSMKSMVNSFRLLIVCSVAMLSLAAPAQAALITFDGLTATGQLTGTPAAGTVLTNQFAAQGVVFGLTGVSAGVALTNNSAFAPSSGV